MNSEQNGNPSTGASYEPAREVRTTSFGEGGYQKGPLDRFGIWLSAVQIRRRIDLRGKDLADVGCGYEADFVRQVARDVRSATCVDVSLSPSLDDLGNVRRIEGLLPDVLRSLRDASFDAIISNSVIEHLWEPGETVEQFRRLLRPGGTCFINVPNWAGKVALETAAFRLRRIPWLEIDDHKHYFTRRELWTLLVKSGFKPSEISVHTHKFGLNNYAVCRLAR